MAGMTTEGGRGRTGKTHPPRAPHGLTRLIAAIAAALIVLAALAATAVARPAGAGISMSTAQPNAGAPKITQQPSSATVEEGQPASFTSVATGATSVQWEVSLDAGKTFAPIEGANSGTYSIAATTLAESGHELRAVFTNASGSTASKAATLTITQKPAITKQPADAFVQEGHEAVFEARASGSPTPTVQWQQSSDGGTTFKNITGAVEPTLRVGNIGKAQEGLKYRAIFKNVAGEATTSAATLHIVELPHVEQQPLPTTAIEPAAASFSSNATGNPAPTRRWEVSTDGGKTFTPIEGQAAETLAISPTNVSENGYRYRAAYTNAAGTVYSEAATLTVEGIPVITQQPEGQTLLVGGTATFHSSAQGAPAPTVQWQLSLDEGGTWSNVANATSETLTLKNVEVAQSGREYRAVFKNAAGATASEAALLTVATTSYRAYGWGLNTRGQAGVGSQETVIPTPTPIAQLSFVTAVAGGPRHSLALLAGGTVDAWGYDGHGQLGNEGEVGTKSPVPVEHLGHVTAIAAGGNHSVALLTNGTVKDWGDDESGQLGNGKKIDSEVPVAVEGLSGVKAIAAGEEHTLALLANGTVMAWGNNERDQLGTGNQKEATTPVEVKNLTGVVAIAANRNWSMALLEGGTVMTWGDDERDQLGNATVHAEKEEGEEEPEEGYFSDQPLPVEGLSGVTAIAAGTTHGVALLSNKTVVALGDDREGQLGNGALEPMRPHPVPVSGLTGVAKIAAGEQDTAAILESGALMTWGMNNAGSLGLGERGEAVDVPTRVTALGMVAGVAAGGSQMIAFGEALPTVTSLSPSSGPAAGSTEVTIVGTGFNEASAVHFGGAAATFTVESPNTIKAKAPAGSGTVDVTVTTAAGTSAATSTDRYTYLALPVVAKVLPKSGPASGGTSVTITGTGFAAGAEVRFAGVPATSVTVNSATSITAVTPANVSGELFVTVTTGGGTSTTSSKTRFKSVTVIESITPAEGPLAGGNTVTIVGQGFAIGAGTTKFKFGKATSKSVQCASTTSCTVLVPAGVSASTVDVIGQANKTKSTATPGDRYTYE